MKVKDLIKGLESMSPNWEVEIGEGSVYGEDMTFPAESVYVSEYDDGELINTAVIRYERYD